MRFIDKALEYVSYVTGVLNAITKGIKAARADWPNSSPFGNGNVSAASEKEKMGHSQSDDTKL